MPSSPAMRRWHRNARTKRRTATMAKITRINPQGISKPFSNYSHVVTAEGAQKLVFCAGQVAADAEGTVLPPDDFEAQAKMVMENLTKALAAGGAKSPTSPRSRSTSATPTTCPRRVGFCRPISLVIRPAARSASCADSPIRISCWRSKRSLRCDQRFARTWSRRAASGEPKPSAFLYQLRALSTSAAPIPTTPSLASTPGS